MSISVVSVPCAREQNQTLHFNYKNCWVIKWNFSTKV